MAESQNAVRKPRRQYKKGLAHAEQYLIELAAKLHEKQKGTPTQADGTRSTDVLGQAIEISTKVFGDSDKGAVLMSTLADYHTDFGEHRSTSNLLEGVAQFHRIGGDDVALAETLRRLSNSYSRQDRLEESQSSREEARRVLAEQLQNSPALSVFENLVRDQVAAEPDCQVMPAGTDSQQSVSEPLRGEVYWTELPQFPHDPHQPRPTLVVSPSRQNGRASHVTVIPIYSKNNGHRHNFVIGRVTGGLEETSVIRCGQLVTIDKVLLRGGPLCRLPLEMIDEVLRLAGDALCIGRCLEETREPDRS